MGQYTPGTEAANWIEQHWDPEIFIAAYEESVIIPLFTKMEKPGKQLNFRKHATLSTLQLGESSAGSSLTFAANTETVNTATPSTRYCATEVNANVLARMMADPEDTLRKSVEMSLAAKMDNLAGALFAALSTSTVGSGAASIDKTAILEAQRKLAVAAKMYYKPGVTPASVVVASSKTDQLTAISDFMSAQVRGDNANPIVTGWLFEAMGFKFYETGSLTFDTSLHNCMFVKPAFGIGYNQRPTVKLQQYQLADRIIAWADFAVIERDDACAVDIQTAA